MALKEIAQKLISQNSRRLLVKGGEQGRNALIEATGTELRELLSNYKGKHIGISELETFYKERFPHMNVSIKDASESGFGGLLNSSGIGILAETKINHTESAAEITLNLNSKSIMDKIKSLLHIKNNKKEFYVSNSFTDNLVHESTHAIQEYTKPTQLLYKNALGTHTKGEADIRHLGIDGAFTYRNLVYKEELRFNPNRFRRKLMHQLNAPYYSTKGLTKDQLKNLIREAQAEQQAYRIGERERLYFKYPRLSRNRLINEMRAENASQISHLG